MWFKRKSEDSLSFKEAIDRLTIARGDIAALSKEIDVLKEKSKMIQGQLSRHINEEEEEESGKEEEEEEEDSESVKYPDGFDFLRK